MGLHDDGFFDGDADIEQAQMEASAQSYHKRIKRALALRAAGDLAGAAKLCPHGWTYPLRSPAAEHEHDPRSGQDGERCLECGSAVTKDERWRVTGIIAPCELEPR